MKKLKGLWVLIILVVLIMIFLGSKLFTFYRDTKMQAEYEGPDAVLLTKMPEEISRDMVEKEIVKKYEYNILPNADSVCVAAFEFLGAHKTDDDTIIMYIVAMDSTYTRAGLAAGGNIPTALTFVRKNGEWVCDEYWEPRGGGYYNNEITKKFPAEIKDKAISCYEYAQKLEEENKQKADDYFKLKDSSEIE